MDRWLLGGDYTLFGAWPAETVERLRELDATWIRGNGERWTAAPDGGARGGARAPSPGARACWAETRWPSWPRCPSQARRLHAVLPRLAGLGRAQLPARARAEDEEELLEGVEAERWCSATPICAFAREAAGGIELVNPGSVGMPFDGDPAPPTRCCTADGAVEHRRVAYDHAASAAAVRGALGAAGEVPARRIERASVRGRLTRFRPLQVVTWPRPCACRSAPRDREFFDLFEEAGGNILRAADLLDQMLRDYPDAETTSPATS